MTLPRSLLQFFAVAMKEIRQTAADKRMIGMLIVAPLIQLTVFGFAVNLDVDRLKTVVVDNDDSSFSRRHVQGLLTDGTLISAGTRASAAAAERALEDGSADVALIVPEGFGRDVERGEPTIVQAIVDGTNPNKSGTAQSTVTRYFADVADEIRAERRSRAGQVPEPPLFELRSRVLNNPSLETAPFMLPGILAIMLLINTALLTAVGLAREKETGTLEQVLVTPIHPLVLMLGKILPSVVIGLFEFLLALAASAWIFDLPLRGSFGFLMGSTCLFLLSTLGVGVLVSTFSKTQQQAFMGVFLFLLPANLLSGMLTPVSSMPGWLEPLTRINPVRYYIEILRSALLEGAGLGDLWMQVAALATFGALILLVSCKRFETRLA